MSVRGVRFQQVTRALAVLAALSLPTNAGAAATFSLLWDSTTNPGSGLGVGTNTIQAAPGDQLVLGIYLTLGSEGTSNYVVSIEFDNDLVNELDLVSTTELAPTSLMNITGGVASTSESNGSQGGTVYSFEASTLLSGPAATTIKVATITFDVNAAVASDGIDVEVGLFSVLVDGIYSNGVAGDLGPTATFNGALVNVISGVPPDPEIPALPIWGLVLGAGLIALAAWYGDKTKKLQRSCISPRPIRDSGKSLRGGRKRPTRTPRKVDPRRPETYRGQGPRCQAEADRDGLED